MSTLALVWGILASIGMVIGFFPCLGALNWLNIPFAVVGLVVSAIAMNKAPQDKKGSAKAGLVLCAVAALIGIARLIAGGGIL